MVEIVTLVSKTFTAAWFQQRSFKLPVCADFCIIRVNFLSVHRVLYTPFRNSSNITDMSAASQCTLAAQMAASGHLISRVTVAEAGRARLYSLIMATLHPAAPHTAAS